jgi:hypothetical protein
MVPYLKGIHLTFDGWQAGRDDEGWKLMGRDAWRAQEAGDDTGANEGSNPPSKVKAKPRLEGDLEALLFLFSSGAPPKCRIRSRGVAEVYYGFGGASKRWIQNSGVAEVYYGFGNASQDGFGFNIQVKDKIMFRFGQWCDAVLEKS